MISVMQTTEVLIRVSSALLTPIIAAFVGYIAYQQWQTNKRQARLALFDKRLVVFNNTVKLLSAVVRDARVELEELKTFLFETRDHEFLFGPDIAQYMEELWRKGTELIAHCTANRQFDRQTELVMWFAEQLKDARTKFKPYMSFPEP